MLRQLATVSNLAWLVAEDFNEILWPNEKVGSFDRQAYHMQAFRAPLSDSGLEDFGFSGPKFTWSKMVTRGHFVQERLDRTAAKAGLQTLFPSCWVPNFYFPNSGHFGVQIRLHGRDQWAQRVWRFEKMWTIEQKCRQLVLKAWLNSRRSFQDCQSRCCRLLSQWHRREYRQTPNRIKALEE